MKLPLLKNPNRCHVAPFKGYSVCRYFAKDLGRNCVVLVSPDRGHRVTMTAAKFLLCCRYGRRLGPNETADHKDGDKLNDSPSNIQLLTRLDNILKSATQRGSTQAVLACATCHRAFYRRLAQVKGRVHFCSLACRIEGRTNKLF